MIKSSLGNNIPTYLLPNYSEQSYNLPRYFVADVARYLGMSRAKLQSWVMPIKIGNKALQPILERPSELCPLLSFTNLVEAYVLDIACDDQDLPLDKIKAAVDYIGSQLNLKYPLASKEFKNHGFALFVDRLVGLTNTSHSDLLADLIKTNLSRWLDHIIWDADGNAIKLYPIQRHFAGFIVIDPNYPAGVATIAGTAIPTQCVSEMYDEGSSIEAIAQYYHCLPTQIEAALAFENGWSDDEFWQPSY